MNIQQLLAQVPEELTTGQVMQVLGVTRKTITRYRKCGDLPYRDAAPSGSEKPDYRYPAEAVLAKRTGYSTGKDPARPAFQPVAQPAGYRPKRLKVR
jgi:hypothetical protein